ncbi:MAG TPA: class I SAM-dependent methyltransferase [Candidatus Binatia bacterium]
MIIGEEIMAEIGSEQAHQASRWLPTSERLLEIGCSSGYLTRHYRTRAKRMVGFDINPSALQAAAKRHPGVPFVCGDVEHLPFREGSFDAIVMLEVIEHTASDSAAIEEVRRTLKPQGALVLSTPHAGLFAFLDPCNIRKTAERLFPRLCRVAASAARFESNQFTENMERHRHYRPQQIIGLLGPDFEVHAMHRGGLLLYPLAAASISVVGRLWRSRAVLRWLFRLLNWDYRRRFGRFSYNLMILGEKSR